jgi:hypothetical protein
VKPEEIADLRNEVLELTLKCGDLVNKREHHKELEYTKSDIMAKFKNYVIHTTFDKEIKTLQSRDQRLFQ